mmetsp:Transcript_42937/g.100857  ORF Transcript_42937/g.100857 Transcript_42937/m.100857 type:complete len:259 (+) Transcript_42937:122-898(+)
MPANAANNFSYGPLPFRSAVGSLDKETLNKLYFRTQASTAFTDRGISEDERGENFLEVHNMGKQAKSKYMSYQFNQAPLVDRSACKYNRDFIPLPLGDNLTNRELAYCFKEGVNTGGRRIRAPMIGRSLYAETFVDVPQKELRSAKQRSCKPEQAVTRTVGGTGDMLETKSFFHESFGVPNAKLAKAREVHLPEGNLQVGASLTDLPQTSYRSTFTVNAVKMMRSSSVPQVMPVTDPRLEVPEEIFTTRRVGYMSPGQ